MRASPAARRRSSTTSPGSIVWDEAPCGRARAKDRYGEAAEQIGTDRFDSITLLREDGHRDLPPRERGRRRRLRHHARVPGQRPPGRQGPASPPARGARDDSSRVRPPRADPRGGRQEALQARGRGDRCLCATSAFRPNAVRAYLEELGVPRHDVHYDLSRLRRLAVEAVGARPTPGWRPRRGAAGGRPGATGEPAT